MNHHIMRSPEDLDQWHPSQSDLTREIDAGGCAVIDKLVDTCSRLMVLMIIDGYQAPLAIWQRHAYELNSKANATDEPYDRLKADCAWNFVRFLQEHVLLSERAREFPQMKEMYQRLFGEKMPEERE